jgi:glycosyltransferase involved in cell wall biosynthesis
VRILWVKANKILPVQSGGDIRSYHIARELARAHELVFLSYYDGKKDPEYEKALARNFPSAVCICSGQPQGELARSLDYLRRAFSPLPYAIGRFACTAVREEIGNYFAQRRFDVAVCDFLDAAVNFPQNLTIPSVVFQHNVESEIWRRHASTNSNLLKRKLYELEFRKMQSFESSTLTRFHHIIAVSEHDRSLMEKWVSGSRISVVPTGVDAASFHPDTGDKVSSCTVLFTGAMDWLPNVDAMEYFCGEIWPLVLARSPEAKLRIVGRNPGERVRKLVSASVEVTGTVPDVREHLRNAAMVVVPLRIGGGTRLKIYEAMAAGKAVVSTSVGAEGLDVHHGRDIVLADTPETFAAAVVTILRDENLRKKYESAALELAAKYDWSTIGDRFATVLRSVSGVPSKTNSAETKAMELAQ